MHRPWIAALLVLGLANAPLSFATEIIDPGQGAVELPRKRSGAYGLSGITYAGGSQYYAVSDRAGWLFVLDIRIDPVTGRITASTVDRVTRLASARDTEGVAYARPGFVWVCDEVGPFVREHRIEDGSVPQQLAVPAVFSNARRNLSLEALAFDPSGVIWFANEEALIGDGPKSSAERGSLVRLQRFDRSTLDPETWVPGGQWAYRTDPIPGEPMGKFARSGVVDLVAIPGGPLLVLERGLGSGGIRSRIYRVDGSRATDTSAHPRLLEPGIEPVQKHLLWEGTALGDNFEGIALGPTLAAGDRSLVLISDDGGVTQPRLYALRIREQTDSLPADIPAAPPSGGIPLLPLAAGIAAVLLLVGWAVRTRIAQTNHGR